MRIKGGNPVAMPGRGRSSPSNRTLRSALCDQANFVVEQVANVVRENTLRELIPELVSAYHRFLNDGAECDKGCRAKLAIVEALLSLDFEDPDFWLTGMQYRQQEPVWNGSIDTASDIRGLCAFGLVRSRLAAPSDLLIAMTDLLTDSEFVARAHSPDGGTSKYPHVHWSV